MSIDPVILIAIYITIAVVLRRLFPNRLTLALMLVVFVCSAAIFYRDYRLPVANAWSQGKAFLLTKVGYEPPSAWPPRLNQPYPAMNLIDQDGNVTSIDKFRGKVVLVELVGMNCPSCVSFSGGHMFGGFGATKPQADLASIEQYVEQFSGGESLENPDIVFVQLLFSDTQMQPTDGDDAQLWAYHFRKFTEDGQYVLAGKELHSLENLKLVPGFHLLDRNLVLRADTRQQNLYTELLPMLSDLVHEPMSQTTE